MKALTLAFVLLLSPTPSMAINCVWPAWEAFKQNLITRDGRVVDPSTASLMTTSEGQSYGMFFALTANDRTVFRRILRWTEDNLAGGDLTSRLPAWSWGKAAVGDWRILDPNSASDADLWMAYSLLEAGRLWNEHSYTVLGTLLAQRIAREEVAELPGLGAMLLPGKSGFTNTGTWRLNPSYLPVQVLTRLSLQPGPWREIKDNTVKLLTETAPKGYSPDWVLWGGPQGWKSDPLHGDIGSYNAIRVYLWIGMLHDTTGEKATLLAHFAPMSDFVAKTGVPPENIDTLNGEAYGAGPAGFSAALLPFLAGTRGLTSQRDRLVRKPPKPQAYYNQVLTLFGAGWDRGRFRFDEEGQLRTIWTTCTH